MTYHHPYRTDTTARENPRPFPKKELTAYKPSLALKRARFYLDVIEAHFAALNLVIPAHDEHAPTVRPLDTPEEA